ncbi:MAG: hypothetical protein V1888_01975 [archaeon]
MKKVIGYGVSILGIIIMAVGFGMIPLKLDLLEGLLGSYVSGVGIALVVVGVIMSVERKGSKVRSGEDEIPIYEGVGKKRRVVGYRRG